MLATPKWIGLTLGMLALIVAFGLLSHWQWERAQRDRAEAAPVPAATVFEPGVPLAPSAYGTVVSATGEYDAQHQVVVVHGNGTYWVVTPLRTPSGVALPVARAAVTSLEDPAVGDVTAGTVTVTGVAQPYEGDPGTPSNRPAGQAERLTAAGLALPYPVAGGWVAMASQAPAPATSYTPVQPPVSADSTASIRLQNASYAVQWLLFAGFVVFFWVRMLRDDLRGAERAQPRPEAAPVREVY
jgi:cytochrome oxidase assembly protein ShyY1